MKRNDINVSLLFDWRRGFRETDGEAGSGGFVPVIVAPAGDVPASDGHFGAALSAGWIGIALSAGVRVTINETVDAALGQVLAVVDRRRQGPQRRIRLDLC